MAVIYLPKDERFSGIGQGLGQGFGDVIARVANQKRDAQLYEQIKPFLNPPPDPNDTSGIPPAPQMDKIAPIAAQMSPEGQRGLGMVMEGWKMGMERLELEKQIAAQQATAQFHQAQIRHMQVGEGQKEQEIALSAGRLVEEQKRTGLEAQRVGIEGARYNLEAKKFPLIMEGLSTTIAKNRATIDKLHQEQSNVLSTEDIKKMAENYAAMGFKNAPNFGFAGSGPMATNRANFWRAVNALPMTPEQRREASIAFQIQQHEATVAGNRLANLDLNMNKAEALYKPITQAFEKLEPILSNPKMLNRFKKAVRDGVGDPAFSQLDNYVRSYLIAYGKAMNNGVLSVHFDEETSKMLDTISSPAQFRAKLESLGVDMRAERKGLETGRSEIIREGQRTGILGGEPSGGPTGDDDFTGFSLDESGDQ